MGREPKGGRPSTVGTGMVRRALAGGVATVCAVAGTITVGAVVAPVAQAVTTVQDLDHGTTATDLAQSLAGQGVTVANVTYTGTGNAAGSFSGAAGSVGFDSGVVMGSGSVQTSEAHPAPCTKGVEGPNQCDGDTTANNSAGDTDLTALAGFSTHDAAVLEFDFTPTDTSAQFRYVFSSDEYSEFANSSFNDVFAFYVNGVNCAVVPGTSDPVSINTINGGNPLGTDAVHPEFYRDNTFGEGSPIDSEMDGLTTVLTCTAAVNADVPNHMKLAIADASDFSLDSNVFIQAGSLVSGTQIATTLTGGDQSGASISVPAGTPTHDSAVLTGSNIGTATGSVTYSVYSDAGCTVLAASAGTKTVVGGIVPDSDAVTLNTPGTYYWRAAYSGDAGHTAVTSACGDEIQTVTGTAGELVLALTPPTSTRTLGDTPPTLALHASRDGAPVTGLAVTFTVVSGPDAGQSGEAQTNGAGDASFVAPAAAAAGTDVIRATGTDGETLVASNDVTVTWDPAEGGPITVSGSASPATVTTGSSTLGHFVITNTGATPLTSVYALVNVSAGGTGVRAVTSQGGCSSFTGPIAACLIFTMAPGQTVTVDVVADSGALPPGSQVTTTIEVHAEGETPVPAAATADVVQPAPGEAIGYVGPGETIATGTSATSSNNTIASLRIPSYGPGAPITLRAETDGVETFCGGQRCDGKILFVSPFEGYTDPRRPIRLKITWDKTVAGRGTKGKLYVQKAPGGPITTVPKCDRTDKHIAIPSPCIHEKEKFGSGDIQYEVMLLSGDPRFARR